MLASFANMPLKSDGFLGPCPDSAMPGRDLGAAQPLIIRVQAGLTRRDEQLEALQVAPNQLRLQTAQEGR